MKPTFIAIPSDALDSPDFLCDLLYYSAYNCYVRKSDGRLKDLCLFYLRSATGFN